jgi:hypothetical protein
MQVVPTSVRTIVILVMLALPGTASAAGVEMLRSTQTSLSSPQLAGDSVVAAAYRGHDIVDLFSGSAAEPAQRLLRLTIVNGSLLTASSGDRVLAMTSSESGASDLYSGPVTGPLTRLATCAQNPDIAFPPGPALDGDLSAIAEADCVRDRIRMQMSTITRTVDAAGEVLALAAAGKYVAWIDARQPATDFHLTVYDVSAGTTAYSAAIPTAHRVDVQADGTAAISYADFNADQRLCRGPPDRIVYFTVAEPAAHTLPRLSCYPDLKIAGGKIAFVEHLGTGAERLDLTNLAGTQLQPVARINGAPEVPDFDYDGKHVALSQTRCRDYRVVRRDAPDTSAEERAVTCPVRLGSPRLNRDGTLHLAVSCPNGCRPVPGAGTEGVEIVSPRWLHVWSRDRRGNIRYSPFVPVNLQAGKRTVVRLPLTSHQRALLRRRHSVSVRLKVLLQNVYLPRVARTAHA